MAGAIGARQLSEQLDRLHRAARALCDSPHDAEDLVQETLVRVLARPRRLRRGGTEPAYLMAALRNTFLHSLRTAGRRPQTVELPVDGRDRLRSARAEPEVAFEQRELLATIVALPEGLRDALLAVDLVGLSYREAARLLDTPEATVTTRLFRARQRIARSTSR